MKYTPKYFYDGMPRWKRIKDPILSRFFYRPLSFIGSSIVANLGISANIVSYFGVFIAILASILYLFENYNLAVLGAILVNVWLFLDCVDGNIARCVRKQPYGEYADSMSSYILVPLLCISVGFYTYFRGGFLYNKGNIWIIFIGCITGLSDTMMRLIYHKYKEVTKHMIELGVFDNFNDDRNDHAKTNSIKVRIESDFGIGGILPIMTLLTTIFDCTDLLLFYCLFYYGGSFVVTTLISTYKAISYRNITIIDPDDKDR